MMKRLRIILAVSLILCSFLVVNSFAADEHAAGKHKDDMGQTQLRSPQSPEGQHQYTELVGKKVKDQQGEEIGKIESFMIGEGGKESFALISGENDKLYPIPMNVLMQSRENGGFKLSMTKEQMMAQAPSFDENSLPNLTESEWQDKVHGYYEKQDDRQSMKMEQQEKRARTDQPAVMPQAEGKQEREMKQSRSGEHFALDRPFRASVLMDKELEDPQGKDLGKINDVIIDQNGNVDYVIVSHGGLWGLGDELTPIPLKMLQPGTEEDTLTVSVNKEKLEQAPKFKDSQWPDFHNREWNDKVYGYYGLEQESD